MPFRPVHEGRAGLREYIVWSFASERALDVRFMEPIVDGDQAVVEYWVTMEGPVTLAGCAFVRFGPGGLVTASRDYWHEVEGHIPPSAS